MLNIIEHHQEIPEEIYRRWMKVIDEEFVETIHTPDQNDQDQEESPEKQSEQPNQPDGLAFLI